MQQQPAYVLHHRPFRDTSQLLDVFSRDHGKLSLVARGSRSARSRLAGLLRPFQPLLLSWSLRTDLGTLTGAEINDRAQSLVGDALMAGYYVNELLLYLLHRHDPQPEVFVLYEETLAALAGGYDVVATLRRFEIELLRLSGYALNLETEARTDRPLAAGQTYEFRPDEGAVPVQPRDGVMIFTGAELKAIAAQEFDSDDCRRDAGRLLRRVIHYQLDGRELKTRKVLKDLLRGKLPGPPDKKTQK
ncbi:MAG: DNA repair protein RecO [Woeseiaceae bacterium]|nr:DNA repair protein RecO [Woeseiaceae bacterium]